MLYVDDETPNLVVFLADFEDEFEILTAASPYEALEILDHQPIAVLLTDHRMPGMSGVDLCERVRDRHPNVLRMLVTAYSDQQTAIDAINRGGVLRYLVKPWDLQEVRQVLRDAVARAQLERTVRRFRSAVLDRERYACLAALRARLLHDLAHASSAVSNAWGRVDRVLSEADDKLEPALRRALRSETDGLREAVGYFVDLHRKTDTGAHVNRPARGEHKVAEVLDTVAELVRGELEGVARLVVSCPGQLCVWADRIDVSRILVNLIAAARQTVRTDGHREGRIELRASRDGRRVLFEVTYGDPQSGGVGRPPTRGGFEGSETGDLGQAISRELAVANGGALEEAQQGEDGGVVVRLFLPAPPSDIGARHGAERTDT